MKALPDKARYKPGEPSEKGNEADALVSTKHALLFLYEEALRNGHHAIAVILRDTLNFCEEIIGDKF